ncbi:hypothetical protein DFJ58DRAFT_771480 [Suillus subalutaceus]|uniref:uncharacterized protein n=1 Tax=Suillus subalutaceus TaxID=48586 RepID=UPI001B85EA6D|nr:uncharacterized protein DFJ58DRAFT_771480 [Suillus subalutaceus]KAG1865535.1 hypothetical protein DFJ58DRAFT_771480 [Suillus subalutaceus]
MYVFLCGAFFTLISVSLWSYYSLRVHVRSAQTPKEITMSCPRYQLRTTLPRIFCKLHLILGEIQSEDHLQWISEGNSFYRKFSSVVGVLRTPLDGTYMKFTRLPHIIWLSWRPTH